VPNASRVVANKWLSAASDLESYPHLTRLLLERPAATSNVGGQWQGTLKWRSVRTKLNPCKLAFRRTLRSPSGG